MSGPGSGNELWPLVLWSREKLTELMKEVGPKCKMLAGIVVFNYFSKTGKTQKGIIQTLRRQSKTDNQKQRS